MEIINLRTELTKAEYDLTRQQESLKHLEASLKIASEKLLASEKALTVGAEVRNRLR